MSNDENSQPKISEAPNAATDDDNKVLRSRFASEISPRGGGNRVSAALEKAGKLFGAPVEEESTIAKPLPGQPAATPVTNRPQVVIGRGGWAAIVIFVLAATALAWAITTIIDLNNQVTGFKTNFAVLQSAQARDPALIALIDSPQLKTYPLQILDPVPEGTVNLHIVNTDLWGLSFNNLNNVTTKDRFFVLWTVRKTAKAGASDYTYIASFGGGNTSAGLFIIPRDKIPQVLDDYKQLVVTDEPLNQQVGANPTGAVHYSLDVSKITQR